MKNQNQRKRILLSMAPSPGWAIPGVLPLLIPAAVLVTWWQASLHGWMPAQILPAPAMVVHSAAELAGGELWSNLSISLIRLVLGLAGGITAGMLLGLPLGLSRRCEKLVLPLFNTFAQIPTLAWIPMFMLLFGIGELLKFVVMLKSVAIPIALATYAGIRQTSPYLREAAISLRLGRRQIFFHLTLPTLLPFFMTGLRLAFSQGWTSLLAVELLASSEGIGYLMVQSRQLFMLDIVFVCILVVGLFSLCGDRTLQYLEKKWVWWPGQSTEANQRALKQREFGLTPWLLPGLLLLIWQGVSALHWVDKNFLPSPLAICQAWLNGLVSLALPQALADSLERMFCGFSLGTGLGCLGGFILGRWRLIDRLAGPFLSALRSVALFAWIPLLTALFGLGDTAKVVFIALAAFFPSLLAAQQGVAQLSPKLVETARVLRLTRRQTWLTLILPGSAPAVFSGVRLSLMHAWLGTIGAEYFMPSQGGIGGMMMRAQQLFQTDKVLVGVMVIGAVGGLFSWLLQKTDKWISAWRYR